MLGQNKNNALERVLGGPYGLGRCSDPRTVVSPPSTRSRALFFSQYRTDANVLVTSCPIKEGQGGFVVTTKLELTYMSMISCILHPVGTAFQHHLAGEYTQCSKKLTLVAWC